MVASTSCARPISSRFRHCQSVLIRAGAIWRKQTRHPRTTMAAGSARFRRDFMGSWPLSLFYSRLSDANPSPATFRETLMTTLTTSSIIDSKVTERAMLKHPFYQAWTEGRLPIDTLRDYARQYFHHVEAFPRVVSAVHSSCTDRDGRRMLAENLAEEEGIEKGKQDHATLWLMFAAGL